MMNKDGLQPHHSADMPPLSDAFISADDAAAWAHFQIGSRRDKTYGGAIYQRDKHYFATVPEQGTELQFNFKHVAFLGDDEQVHPPEGYTLSALYHSHAVEDALVTEEHGVMAWLRSLILPSEVKGIVHHSRRFGIKVHYVSAAVDVLLKYIPGNSDKTRELSAYEASPSGHDLFSRYFPLMAEAGELWVILANSVWGGKRGRVEKTWKLYEPLSGAQQMQPLFSSIAQSPAIANLIPAEETAQGKPLFGYLLKALDKDEYIVPAPAWERAKLTAPRKLFAQRPEGGVLLPDGFRIEGIYCRLYPQSDWLHPSFFTPTVLAAMLEQWRAEPTLYNDQGRLRLFLRTRDRALLGYTFSGTDAEAQWLGEKGATVDQRLKEGTLSPGAFAMQLAAIGELTVIQAGGRWPKVGRVIPGDGPFEQLLKTMSPAFLTADDAARYLHERIHVRDEDLLGCVLQRHDGRFVSTAPLRESDFSRQLGLSFDGEIAADLLMPSVYRLVGFLVALKNDVDVVKSKLPARSNEAAQPGLSLDEEAMLYTAVPNYAYAASITAAHQKIPTLYYSSPFGSLVKYARSGAQDENTFSGFLREGMRENAVKPQLDGFDGTSVEMVRKMLRIGEFSVVVSSTVWGGARGKVPADWVAFKPFVASAPVQPGYSWVFQDAQTAAAYSHDQWTQTEGRVPASFILKAAEAQEYVVTLTATAAADKHLPQFSPLRVFPKDENARPLLPSGYQIHGMCYPARPTRGLKIDQAWLYECFVAPQALASMIAASREPGASLEVLYCSTRDGAQLEYVFSAGGLESQLYGITPTGAVTDNGIQAALLAGSLTPVEFVKRVAAAGQLSVQRVGTLWDVAGRVDERWQPYARYPVPAFSAAFLTADDAARHAHEQMAAERDIEQCGLILQTLDQRFVATLPMPCRTQDRFVIDGVFPTDHSGTLIVPAPYTLFGQYASCTAVALLQPQRMQHYKWSRNEAVLDWQLFRDAELHRIIGNRHLISVAYLSSAQDALIAYDLSGSAPELALQAQLAPGPQGSLMERRRERGEMPPQALVRELARTGLRIVQGNRLWGANGTPPDDWRAFPAAQAYERPEQVAFGAIFSSAHGAAKDAHARLVRGPGSTQTGFGFVLKHEHKDEYVVSQVAPSDASTPLFNLASLFKTADDGAFVYPAGFALYGLFYARRWMPEPLSYDQRWLAGHFITSSDLYSAYHAARRWRDKGADITLSVFISTLDNALLVYQTPISTRLFDAQRQLSGNFEDVHTRLASGQLTPQAFVAQVIAQCWLSVIVANDCWDEVGKLGADWTPYADFNRRALSPAFFSQDDAVRYAWALLGARRDQVYGGLVLRRVDGLYVSTEPLPVMSENFDPKGILPDEDVRQDLLAPGMKIVARYRSRLDRLPAFPLPGDELAVYRNLFSTEVLSKALDCNHLWRHEYLFGLDGSIISFTCNDADRDLLTAAQQRQEALDFQQLKQALAPHTQTPHDPASNRIDQQLRDGHKTPTEFVNQLLKVTTMSVVQGSELWGTAQKLPRGWLPAYGFVAPERGLHALADRALSPVFSHIDDVARHVHGHAGTRGELTFGFILGSRDGLWMASLPVAAHNLQFPMDSVFVRGQLPSGWTVQGLYLCTPARQPDELSASPVYRSFIPPSVLRAALWALRRSTTSGQSYWPLYLSCTDSALLCYRASIIDSDWDSENRLQAYVKKLNGNFNPADYIHQVARAGRLEVLITGEIWATQGPVSSNWAPGKSAAYVAGDKERLPLGPLFAHADDAARYPWRRYRHDSGKAWLGAVLSNATGHTFLVTEPVDDSGPSVAVGLRAFTPAYQRLFVGETNLMGTRRSGKYPEGFHVVGVQQLYKLDATRERLADRYQDALADNFVAQRELSVFVDMFRLDQLAGARYYFTPRNGGLLVYVPSYQASENDLLLSGWLDPETDKAIATPNQVVTTLANAGRLHILQPDSFWKPQGHVTTRFLLALRKRYR